MLMAATGDYTGGIDGALGPIPEAAIRSVESRHANAYTFDHTTTTNSRPRAAVAKACLKQLARDAG